MKKCHIECPGCGTAGAHSLPEAADLSDEPEIKERLLNGSLFEWDCPGCSRRFFVDEVFLCRNAVKGYCVYLVPGYAQSTLPIPTIYKSHCTGTLRVTASYVDFAEKLRILEARLDDRIIEAVKALYATACQQEGSDAIYSIVFDKLLDDGSLGFTVMLENDEFSIDIPKRSYEQAYTDFDTLLPNTPENMFYKIDQFWLAEALGSPMTDEDSP